VEYHNELYLYIQYKHSLADESTIEAWFESKGIKKIKSWVRERNGAKQSPYKTTLCTYIRNSIHHPENKNNQIYSNQELIDSITSMAAVV